MAGAYYRPPEKRIAESDYMRERYHKGTPLGIGITAAGRTEIIDVPEAKRIVQQLQEAIMQTTQELPEVQLRDRRWR